MSMRKRKSRTEENNLAFLDIISCGFGAVVLLLLIIKVTAPESIEDSHGNVVMQNSIEELQLHEQEIRDEIQMQEQQLQDRQKKLAQIIERLGENKRALHNSEIVVMTQEKLEGQFEAALQSLDAEMRTLKINQDISKVGGIPADSSHIIFVIDTSGSMRNYSWHKVREQMSAILDAYPKVDGLQVMNDMGEHLFEGYRGRWMKDTKTTRKRILDHINTWSDFSNSNPVEGIYTAISLYASKTKKISIYILGDDFSGSIQQVLEEVDKLTQNVNANKIRIHAVGFFTPSIANSGFLSFARLTALTRKNRGTFVGISTRE